MNPDYQYIPVITLNGCPEDLAISITERGYRIVSVAQLDALGKPVDWAIDHQDRIVYLDANLDRKAFTRAVNAAYDEVKAHEPKALPRDRRAPQPNLSAWAVPSTPEPGPDDWVEERYELHRTAYERFIEVTKGYDRNTARLATLIWWCGLTPEQKHRIEEAQTAEAIAHVGPTGWFMGIDCKYIHVAISPVVRRLMKRSTRCASEARPGSLAGWNFAPAFYGFGWLDRKTIAGAMIDAAMLMSDSPAT